MVASELLFLEFLSSQIGEISLRPNDGLWLSAQVRFLKDICIYVSRNLLCMSIDDVLTLKRAHVD